MNKFDRQLNVLEMLGYKRAHIHKSIDSTSAVDITVPTVDNNLQYDSPTITRVTKQFAENIKRLSKYVLENAEALKTTNLSTYITTDTSDENGTNKIFVAAPCTMTSERTLALKKCTDIQSVDTTPALIASFMMEDPLTKNEYIVGVSEKAIIRMKITGTDDGEYNAHPDVRYIYTIADTSDLVIKRVGFADANRLYLYVITNFDIRLFKTLDICNESLKGSIDYCNIVDFKNSFSDDHHRYDDNLVVEDIYRKNTILDKITSGNFHDFIDKYYKIGDFPKNVLEKIFYSNDPDPVSVYDVGIVTGKYGIYQIHCYSAKPKTINEFDQDYTVGESPDDSRGSLHIRCLDNKPVKDAFFYEDKGETFLIALNGWPKSDISGYSEARDNQYKGVTVLKIDEESSAAQTQVLQPVPFYHSIKHDLVHNVNLHGYAASEKECKRLEDEEEYKYGNVSFRIFSKQMASSVPLYRVYSSKLGYFFSIDEAEINNKISSQNFTNKQIAGYVYNTTSPVSNPGNYGIKSVYRLKHTYPESSTEYFYCYTASESKKEEFLRRGWTVDKNTAFHAITAEQSEMHEETLLNYLYSKTFVFNKTPPNGEVEFEEGVSVNINQVVDSRGINGAYVNGTTRNGLMYAKVSDFNIDGIPVNGFVLKYNDIHTNYPAFSVPNYWFVSVFDRSLINVTKVYNRHEFNCLAEYKVNEAAYSFGDNSILLYIKGIGLVEGIKEYDKVENTGFRFRIVKTEESFGNEKILAIYVMNRCFVAVSSNKIYFVISTGELNVIQLNKDINTNVKEIHYSCTYDKSNAFCIGYNKNGVSKLAIISLKYSLNTDKYYQFVTQNLTELISDDFMAGNNSISKAIEKHIKEMHNKDSIVGKLNSIINMLKNISVMQATGHSENMHVSEIVLNYPNNGDDFAYVETDDNSTNIYGRINSNTVNANPTLTTLMKRNSNAITYYDTILDEEGNTILSSNKLIYSMCRLSQRYTRLTVNIPSTGTYYVDNIAGWSCGNRTGSTLKRKNLGDGFIPGQIESCTTRYQLVLNRMFFNIKDIVNVTAQLTSTPLQIYSNTNEFDVRHYGMYDSPIVAPLSMNKLTDKFKYDMSDIDNDEITLSFSIFGGDAMQINILIENYE